MRSYKTWQGSLNQVCNQSAKWTGYKIWEVVHQIGRTQAGFSREGGTQKIEDEGGHSINGQSHERKCKGDRAGYICVRKEA